MLSALNFSNSQSEIILEIVNFDFGSVNIIAIIESPFSEVPL